MLGKLVLARKAADALGDLLFDQISNYVYDGTHNLILVIKHRKLKKVIRQRNESFFQSIKTQ